ncbi:MAG: hypothetical protein VYC34_02360, partial [Planctomycetota bacterium]|nr:hypothetical protein [Planctomycetota bacterium]
IGINAAGNDMTRLSFRHGDPAGEPQGNIAYYDGSVRLELISRMRRPEPWLPRGSRVQPIVLADEIRDLYPQSDNPLATQLITIP